MDATDRKNAWMNLEDEFWEIEKRWQWLHRKVKNQLEDLTNRSQKQEVYDEKALRTEISIEEKINKLQNSFPNTAFISAFHQYCKDVYEAVQETTKTMSAVKKLMWNTWDNDTICESFYDAIQFSQQLLESLSTSWSVAFSLFRARELDLLYRSEKLVHQATNAHQMSLKFILSCWQTYLAAHCHSWTARLNHARTRVKDSGHTVGQMFSKGLVSSHALTVAIAKGLQPLTAYKIMSAQMELNTSDNECDVRDNIYSIFKSANPQEKKPNESFRKDVDVKTNLSLMKVSSDKSDAYPKEEEVAEMEDSYPSTPIPSENENSTDSLPHSGAEKSKRGSGKSTYPPKGKKSNSLASEKEPCKKVLFIGTTFCDGRGQSEQHPPTSGLRAIRCEANSLYSSGQQGATSNRSSHCNTDNPSSEIKTPPPLPKSLQQREPGGERQKHKKMDESDSLCSKCKCCCDGKRRRLDSMSTSSTSSSTSEGSDRDFTSQSNCVTVTSNTQPEFKIQEWEALLVDVIDLNKEWKSLSTNLSADSFENKFKSEIILNKEGEDKTDSPADIEETPNKFTDDIQDLKIESFETILSELIASMNRALNLSSSEIKNQVKTWTERERRNELRLHFKGYDPNEAILQAKSFLFQLMQSFFAMLLLTAADTKRRMLCYASLLPESIAESRKFAYSLILSREISTVKRGNQESVKRNNEKQPSHTPPSLSFSKAQVVNPHPLCHHLAMALSKAHSLSSKFITLVSKAED